MITLAMLLLFAAITDFCPLQLFFRRVLWEVINIIVLEPEF